MLTLTKTDRVDDALIAKGLLAELDHIYPHFATWFDDTLTPQLATGEATLIVARDGDATVGVAIGKSTAREVKLRCVYVAPSHRCHGVGVRLVKAMLIDLRCPLPYCTVAEETINEFSRLLVNHFKFKLTRVEKGRYRPGKLEYIFNDEQPRSSSAGT